MKNFLKKIIAGLHQVRSGDLVITRNAHNKMTQYGLKVEDIEDAWRYGKEADLHKIVRIYRGSRITLVTETEVEGEKTILVTCWKSKNWY